ncbi:MAG: hypothetical protein AB1591_11445 [Pseudomonadota bacterium]
MKYMLLTGMALLLWACDTPHSYGPHTPYYRFPPGVRLALNQPLEIPANWATARLQHGRPVPFGHVQEQEPHCIFEIDTVRAVPQRVEADVFAVTSVRRSVSELAGGAGFFVRSALADDDAPAPIYFKTTFMLRSEKQPGVLRMVCQAGPYSDDIARHRHLTVAEIREALGRMFTLELPDGGA